METMRWLEEGYLELLDQSKLPLEVTYLKCKDYLDVADAIRRLAVRGAPAIGAAAAYGLVLGASKLQALSKEVLISGVEATAKELMATRPTAVNLRWAMDRLLNRLRLAETDNVSELKSALLAEAKLIYQKDLDNNRKIGEYGQALIPAGARILTHCNAGALATAGFGTALGVIRAAHEAGKNVSVYADETRPLLQGARLTTWEMLHDNIPVTLITDNMAGYSMACGRVDLIIVGADRITANGDTANKIGTYSLAILAQAHHLPFYVAAPVSTVDLSLASGAEIPIEERESTEVTHFNGHLVAPAGVKVWNPAFDVTPNRLITAIITELGVIGQPYSKNLQAVMS
ncbi:MAG: Methylthioribose-1-phosphate isomerase [Pelotomaculum sp. PtaB.Bin104]|nr:MAG: Methylthioribose-1-phosphate isomerase [Pelotomaculum sp. PtaB.Bin104]